MRGHDISSGVCLSDVRVVVPIRARRVFVLGTVLASLFLVALPRARALDPDRRISQYAHTAWRVRDGAFAGAPTTITQTTDGYVWIGTFAGLVRFDGIRFVPFVLPAGKQLPNSAVISLLGATDGSLWIGTASGLAQWKNGVLFNFPETAGRVNSIYEDGDGTIWMARSRTDAGGVCKVAVSVATCYTPKDGVPPNANVLIRDNLGFFLIGHSTGIVRWKPGSSTSYELPGLRSNTGLAGISDLALAPDGSVLAGLWHPGHGLGLEQLINSSWKAFIAPALGGSRLRVSSLRLDRHSALWIATYKAGLYRVHNGNVDHFGSADGLSSDSVESVFEDREGNLWLTTAGGVDCFRNIPLVSFTVHEGLSADAVGSILAARDGTVWIGNHEQLDFVRGNVVSSIGPKQGLRGDRVTSLFEDHAGRIWVGVDNGLFVYEHGRVTPVHRPDGGPVGIVLAMTEDIDHNVWASVIRNPPGRPTRLICFREGRFVKEISDQRLDVVSLAPDPQSGLWLGLIQGGLARYRNDQVQVFPLKDANARVEQLLANSNGSVLAATNRGLVEQQGDTQHTLDDNNGLPCNRIYALVTDKHSDLWLYAECGLIRIKSDDLQRWREHPDLKVKFDLFDAFDGAQPYLPPFRPAATRSNDGRLWFANDTVAQMIDPDGPLRNPIPPPVHIENVIADRKPYWPQSGLHLPPLSRDLEIDYTALSFVVPQKVHFQYKLEGYDRDWQDAGTRRQAFYSNLPPRHYTFRVKACNNSSVWNEGGASLDFFVAPAYYQTLWFRSLGVLLFLAVLAGVYRLRVRHLEGQRDALRKSEKELRDVIDTIPALVWSALPDGSNIYVNKRFVEYTGSSGEQVAGSGWQGLIHPDDLERHSSKWMEAVAIGKPHESEVRSRRADGQYRWQLDRGVPLRDKDGNIVKWYGVTTDIEDRKRAEEALQLVSSDLQDSKAKLEEAQRIAHVGYWEWDLTSNHVNWSDETYRIYGLRPQEYPIDITVIRKLIHPGDLEFVFRVAEEAIRGGLRTDVEHRIIRPSGELRTVHSQGDVKKDESGRPCQMFGTVQDITDRKRTEEALQVLSRDLQESNAMLEEAQHITHVGYWERDLATDRVTWSDETYRIFGLQPQEDQIDLAALRQKIHPEDWKFVSRALDEALGGGGRYDIEYRVLRPTGEVRIVHSTGDVKRDASGQPCQIFGTVQDITDRKRADEALQQSQVYINEGQRLAHMGSWAFNAAGFEYWSPELFRIYGLDPNGKPPTTEQYLALVHPDDRAFMEQGIAKMLDDHLAFDFTKRIVRPDGEIRHVRCVGVPVTQGGIFRGFLGTGMDVTEQEQLTEELRLSEQYLSEGQRLAHMGSWAFNPSGFFDYWSQELFQIYGLDPQKVAPTLEEYLATIHPQDRDSMANTIKRMCAERVGCDEKKRIIRPDGQLRYIRCVGIPVLEGEVLKGFLGTAIDVTEQELLTQELERQQAHLTEAQKLTHTGSWAWRVPDRNAVEVSEEFYRIFGFDPAERAPTWEEYFERIHPEDRLKWKGITERAIVEKAGYDHEFRILLPNGKMKWIRTVGHPVLSGVGDLEQFVGSSTDITGIKSAEQEREKLRQLEADLAHINRVSTLGEMAASLAHEIKQPIAAAITSANSCIEWLAHEPPNLDRARAAAARIDKYGNRAAEIIDRIRSFYRKSPSQRELVNLNGIVQEMLTLLQGEASRFSVAMHTELAPELPKITVDRVQLQQVFMNLMLNAIEAMQDSGGELTVKSQLRDGQLQFSVSDTGVGLPSEGVDQMFSAFFTTKPQGSGMGLAISRSIVESHGGRLWAAANGGRGATFNFTLPTQAPESSPLVA
jgi:PAS domain S-box-containing protein